MVERRDGADLPFEAAADACARILAATVIAESTVESPEISRRRHFLSNSASNRQGPKGRARRLQ
jgi:hypothetical protein